MEEEFFLIEHFTDDDVPIAKGVPEKGVSNQTRRYLDTDPMLPGLRRLVDLARDGVHTMPLRDDWRMHLGDLVDVLDRGIERTDHPDDRGRYSDALSCLLAALFETEAKDRAYLGGDPSVLLPESLDAS